MEYALYDDIENFSDDELAAALTQVSEQRREKALKYRYDSGKKQSVIAYMLLKRLLEKCYGISSNPVFIEGEHGKPVMAEHKNIHFNMSHCQKAVACVVDDNPIGIDIENIPETLREGLCEYVFDKEELTMIHNAENPQIEFARLWTMKESYVKFTGTGIFGSNQLKGLLHEYFKCERAGKEAPVVFHTEVNENKGWVMTICKRS